MIFIYFATMLASIILIIRQEKAWRNFFINLISAGIYCLVLLCSPKAFNEYFMFFSSIILIIPPILSSIFCSHIKIFYFLISLICFTRMFGLPFGEVLGEEKLMPIFLGGIFYIFLLWVYFIFSYSKKYKKFFFWGLGIWITLIFFDFMVLFFNLENIMPSQIVEYLNLAYILSILLGIVFYIPYLLFFYMGEFILFFYLCSKYFKKLRSNPHPKTPNA